MLDKIILDKNPTLALEFLEAMRHREYEGFEVIEPKNINNIS